MGKNRQNLPYSTKIKIAVDHGGRCAFCGLTGRKMYTNSKENQQLDSFDIGEFAHIHSETSKGPRYDKSLSKEFLISKDNFLYLCSNHHHMIDDNPKNYPADVLKQKKRKHIELVNKTLNISKTQRIVVLLLRDDYFGQLNTSTIQTTLDDNEFVVNYLDIRNQTKNPNNIKWFSGFQRIKLKWDNYNKEFLSNVHTMIDCNHIYSITQIPYAFYFGLLLKETNKFHVHQWNRSEQYWEGDAKDTIIDEFIIEENLESPGNEDIILKIELSAVIDDELIRETDLQTNNVITMKIDKPSRFWLKNRNQVKEFILKYRSLMEDLNKNYKKSKIHLFYAGPVPPIMHIGSSFNLRMDLPLFIYYFKADPKRIKGKYIYVCNTNELMEKELII